MVNGPINLGGPGAGAPWLIQSATAIESIRAVGRPHTSDKSPNAVIHLRNIRILDTIRIIPNS